MMIMLKNRLQLLFLLKYIILEKDQCNLLFWGNIRIVFKYLFW